MICAELNIPENATDRVKFQNYHELHQDGQRLIRGWFERAWDSHESLRSDDFEALIFLWISFNGWASCTTGIDQDSQIIKALAPNEIMNADFDRILTMRESPLAGHVAALLELLPIFDAKSLKRKRALSFAFNDDDRVALVERYLATGETQFEPKCWQRHRDAREQTPRDWPHVLKAIYKIRCNLFHGHKAAHSEMDRQIVSAAFMSLYSFIAEAGYLR